MKTSAFMIAAPQSGSGKTTITLAIMAAVAKRGFKVIPFKCGPDFIDTGYHTMLTGIPSINLDAWICPKEQIKRSFKSAIAKEPENAVAIIEGAMGLFDGIGLGREGSSAEIAALTKVPVLLVINAKGMATSVAALVKGFTSFDPDVKIAGVIFNNVGSKKHSELLKDAMARYLPEIPCFGTFQRNESITIPSRHLGLITAEDNPLKSEYINNLADLAESSLNIENIIKLNHFESGLISTTVENITAPFIDMISSGGKIAVARDKAFCFIYEDNLRILSNAGLELIFFSPLTDVKLPDNISGIYLPGGYPELHAKQLAENESMIKAIQLAIASDMPVYAECGGFIYLTEGVSLSDNSSFYYFVAAFPVKCKMLPNRKALGYRQIELEKDCLLGKTGKVMRGHEFHYSEISQMPDNIERCYKVSRGEKILEPEGYKIKNCLASYIHLHFGS